MNTKQLFSRVIMGAWVIVERHERGCSCSYCADERVADKKIRVVLPKCKARNSWRRITYRDKTDSFIYFRSTLPKLSHFFGFDYSSWNTGYRLKILPAPIARTNSLRALLTVTNSKAYATKIRNVESLFWCSMIRGTKLSRICSGTTCESR